jgi:hypothetical protein
MGLSVAVAVQGVPQMVLDEGDLIVQFGPDAQAPLHEYEGRNLWEAFPDSKPLFHPYYEQARRTGEPVEFVQFYAGYVTRVRAVPAGSQLHVYWDKIDRIDTLTLENLRDSLSRAVSAIEEEEAHLRREQARSRLHVVDGDVR